MGAQLVSDVTSKLYKSLLAEALNNNTVRG